MAQLLDGTRVYGTATINNDLIVGGNVFATGAVIQGSTGITTAATITPVAGAGTYYVTALATGGATPATTTINAPTISAQFPTLIDGQKLVLRIKDNGTARPLSWTISAGAYRAINLTLPTTTIAGKVLYVATVYNAQDNFWDVVATIQQA